MPPNDNCQDAKEETETVLAWPESMKLLLRTLDAECKARDVISSDARPERLTDHAPLMKPEVLHAYKAHAVYMCMLIHHDTCTYQ